MLSLTADHHARIITHNIVRNIILSLNHIRKQISSLRDLKESDETNKTKIQQLCDGVHKFKDDSKYGWDIVKHPRVEYTLRYDKYGAFIMAAPVVVPRRNNPSIN